MKDKVKKEIKTYWCYWNQYGTVQVRSIGHKWVWLRHGSSGRFSKIKRGVWDKITSHESFMTIKEKQYQIDIRKKAIDLGIAQTKPTKILKSHPTRRFGWMYKTFDEIESEVNAILYQGVA